MYQTGFAFALFHLVAGVTVMKLRKVVRDTSGVLIFFLLLLCLAGSTLGLLAVVGIGAWLFILPQQAIRSVAVALFSASVNKAVPDNVRATALSVRNAVRVSLYVFVMMPWWLGIDFFGKELMFCFNLGAIFLAIAYFWYTCPRALLKGKGI